MMRMDRPAAEPARDVLRELWRTRNTSAADLEDAFGEAKTCKSMASVGFDGMAEPGTDLRAAWRDRLEREGKLATGTGTVRDLVLGSGDAH
jgi:hypothetical protein